MTLYIGSTAIGLCSLPIKGTVTESDSETETKDNK